MKARTAATKSLRSLVVTAPEPLRVRLYGLTRGKLVTVYRRLRAVPRPGIPNRWQRLPCAASPSESTHLAERLVLWTASWLALPLVAHLTPWPCLGSGRTLPALSWSRLATTPTASVRKRLRASGRRRAHPCFVGPNSQAPAAPRQDPGGQQRAACRGRRSPPLLPSHPSLRRQAPRRRHLHA